MTERRRSIRSRVGAASAAACLAVFALISLPQTASAASPTPTQPKYNAAELAAATAQLRRSAAIPGTAWAVDPATHQVVVTADKTVTGASMDRLDKTVTSLGDRVRLTHTRGALKPFLASGDAIYGGATRCSVGFNVRSGSTDYLITAGHCGNVANTWYTDRTGGSLVGPVITTKFPGNDYAIIRYDNPALQRTGGVDLYNGKTQDITGVGQASVGQAVQRSGSTSHLHSGKVTAVNVTVNYAEGTVTGLIQTDICAEAGDSGGPLFDGQNALGVTSGGTGDCTLGGLTYFQPVAQPLAMISNPVL